jgi:2-polyprenyl-3-methyl-5-hydroxy-6-metoxy-1,4-benzoquinol methylase
VTPADRWLQRWRIAKALPFVGPGARVLDIGCGEGELLRRVAGLADGSIGVDPTLSHTANLGPFRLVRGVFPGDVPQDAGPFDAITMLAVLEHLPEAGYESLAAGAHRLLKPGGRIIITVPAAAVDRILAVLKALRVIHGMSLEEHHGYDVNTTGRIFAPPRFSLEVRRRFQLGLNNLFVFRREA